ncbi:MAG: NAD-dependent deacetylase [Campylobacter sp.]|nr:NAD-dependent deacetylase [Campylobacter sp.]
MKKVLILSGAGLSAESGLKTFRDSGGLWENYDVNEVCSVQGFAANRAKVLKFYDKLRVELKDKVPNKAHEMIARVKEKYGDQISVMTQNVDDLLERAGCKDVVHLHGFLPQIRCENCDFIENIGYDVMGERKCKSCGSDKMRHDIVMFGEQAPFYGVLYDELYALRMSKSLFVCIGSSGEVLDVASFASFASFSILNNLEASSIDHAFSKCFIGRATAMAEKIEHEIDEFLA